MDLGYPSVMICPFIKVRPSVTICTSVTVCPSIAISSPVVVIGHSVVNKLQGKQILASYVLAKSQWIIFWYGPDCYIVIQ